MKKLLAFAIICALSVSGCGFPTCGPWQGTVIDAETRQPIEGAVVVAVWKSIFRSPAGEGTRYLDAEEVLTDKDGAFRIPARKYLSVFFFREVQAPRFTIFKPAYGSFPQHQVSPRLTPEDLFEGDGAVVELPRLKTKEERLKNLPGVPNYVPLTKLKHLVSLLDIEAHAAGLKTFYKEIPR